MTLGLVFWILMLLWLIYGVWQAWPTPGPAIGNTALLFFLFLVLGWAQFGAPIR
jgi:O-antigen ligase